MSYYKRLIISLIIYKKKENICIILIEQNYTNYLL